MTKRLLLLYLLIVIGPLIAAAVAFAARDLLTRLKPVLSLGNGHAEPDVLEHTVEEVRASGLEQSEGA